MKIGQVIYYIDCSPIQDGFAPKVVKCQVVGIRKNDKIRVKVFGKDGEELNDFVADRRCFCVSKRTALHRLNFEGQKMLDKLRDMYDTMRVERIRQFIEAERYVKES